MRRATTSRDKVYESKRDAEFGQVPRRSCAAQAIIEWKNDEMHKLWMARTAAAAPPAEEPGLVDDRR